jgi:hypothetical protein
MLDHIEKAIDADSALAGVFQARFTKRFKDAPMPVSLKAFPAHPGTVELSIWDNQPHGQRTKAEGDNSRERPARYAVSVRASVAGHRTPLTTKQPDFYANVGDLFTADQIRARLKRAWKAMDPEEMRFLVEQVLPGAEAKGLLIARLCVKRSAKAGGGTHWHPYHYALISAAEIEARTVEAIMLVTGPDSACLLPACSTLDGAGKPFKMTTKETRSGPRHSTVVGQSRATDLQSTKMQTWATGRIAQSGG